jgi:hypothetical protein
LFDDGMGLDDRMGALQRLFDGHLIDDVLTHAPLDVCIRCCGSRLVHALQVKETRNWDEGTLAYCLIQQNLFDFANRVGQVKHCLSYHQGWKRLTRLNEDDFYVTAAVLSTSRLEFPSGHTNFCSRSFHQDILKMMTFNFQRDDSMQSFIFTLNTGTERVLRIELNLGCTRVNSFKHVFTNDCSIIISRAEGFKVQFCFNPVGLCLISDDGLDLTKLEFNCVVLAGLLCPSSNSKFNMNALNNFVKRKK